MRERYEAVDEMMDDANLNVSNSGEVLKGSGF